MALVSCCYWYPCHKLAVSLVASPWQGRFEMIGRSIDRAVLSSFLASVTLIYFTIRWLAYPIDCDFVLHIRHFC
jgi:hypothetical protein